MNTRQYSEKKKKPSVGFIGMGHMGSAMAQRLLEAGYLLTIYDRTPARGQPLASRELLWPSRPETWQRSVRW